MEECEIIHIQFIAKQDRERIFQAAQGSGGVTVIPGNVPKTPGYGTGGCDLVVNVVVVLVWLGDLRDLYQILSFCASIVTSTQI